MSALFVNDNHFEDNDGIAYKNTEVAHKNAGLNYGSILEKAVRKDCMGISEIARKLQVSRRTLYNWFESENLDLEVFYKVGLVTGHDFSKEIPGFEEEKKRFAGNFPKELSALDDNANTVYYWMERYIHLLEKYNSILRELNLENGE
jgi:transcriptional regulator with XRE-family HTH domain